LTPLCLVIQTLTIDFVVASGNGNRLFAGKLHVKITNKLRSPQCQTKAPLPEKIYIERRPSFSVSLELGRREKVARHPSADFLTPNLSPPLFWTNFGRTVTLLQSVGRGGKDFVDTIIAVKML